MRGPGSRGLCLAPLLARVLPLSNAAGLGLPRSGEGTRAPVSAEHPSLGPYVPGAPLVENGEKNLILSLRLYPV